MARRLIGHVAAVASTADVVGDRHFLQVPQDPVYHCRVGHRHVDPNAHAPGATR
jgi:hypothetical protein